MTGAAMSLAGVASLGLAMLSPAALEARGPEWWDSVLGVAMFGGERLDCIPAAIPAVAVDAPPFDAPPLYEVWTVAGPLASGCRGALRYRCSGSLLFGSVVLDDGILPAGEGSALQRATARAYGEVFALLDALGFPFLWRVWNYLPEINREVDGSERYWQFNSGRQDAFQAAQRMTEGEVPAACALGTRHGRAILYFIALRGAPLALENPRQLAAYYYPEQYGPRSPTFSRASLARLDGGPVLFVSGTASIVGHETLHPEDAVAQTCETLRNIEAVVAEARRRMPAAGFDPGGLAYKVYIRHERDYPAIRETLRRELGDGVAIEFLHADVCRRDLLVEIEASGGHGLERQR